MTRDVIVVGAGAAGIIAAWRAASLGARVTLIEKTNRIGTKILVSGGGKCNITHDGPLEDVLRAFRPNEGRFLRPAFYRFQNHQIVEMFTSRGLEVYTRPDGRIFPVHQTAKDVVAILAGYLEEVGVEVLFESPVKGLIVEDSAIKGVRCRRAQTLKRNDRSEEGGYRARTAKNLLRELDPIATQAVGEVRELRAERVIVCPGGSSYPNSGTTGDGWDWARAIGHTVEPTRAALAPIYLENPAAERSGIALRDVVLKGRQGKEFARWRGDLLFTHQGISGPCALGISRLVAERSGPVSLEIDVLPDENDEGVSVRLLQSATAHPGRATATLLDGIVPDRVTSDVLAAAGLDPATPLAQLDRRGRNRLAAILKAWPIGTVRHVPLEKGEVVAGGISLGEVDSQTMASRKMSGLYLAGELLDIAGPVGGYNLQAAFAMGYTAGEAAATSPDR